MVGMLDKNRTRKHVSLDMCVCPFTLLRLAVIQHTCLIISSYSGCLCFSCALNSGFTPDMVFTLRKRCPAEEGSAMAVSSVFCFWAFAMISEKRYWGVLPQQHRMELRWIVALCQGLSLRVSRVCLLRVNHAYQFTVSLQAVCKVISRLFFMCGYATHSNNSRLLFTMMKKVFNAEEYGSLPNLFTAQAFFLCMPCIGSALNKDNSILDDYITEMFTSQEPYAFIIDTYFRVTFHNRFCRTDVLQSSIQTLFSDKSFLYRSDPVSLCNEMLLMSFPLLNRIQRHTDTQFLSPLSESPKLCDFS